MGTLTSKVIQYCQLVSCPVHPSHIFIFGSSWYSQVLVIEYLQKEQILHPDWLDQALLVQNEFMFLVHFINWKHSDAWDVLWYQADFDWTKVNLKIHFSPNNVIQNAAAILVKSHHMLGLFLLFHHSFPLPPCNVESVCSKCPPLCNIVCVCVCVCVGGGGGGRIRVLEKEPILWSNKGDE